jgi:hypothetical protein
MATSIDEKRRDVQAAFEAAFKQANEGEPGSLAAFEPAVWTLILALGRALVALWIARCAARPRLARYEHDGRTYEIVGTERGEVGTRFGKIAYEGPVGRLVGWKRAARDLPLDRELGLCGGFSLLAVTTLVRLCGQMAFASARKTFRDMFEWSPSPRATLRMVDGVGAEARPFLDQAPPPEDDGEVLVITVDGKGAPAISSREHARRTQPHQRPKSGTTRTKRQERRERRRKVPRQRRTSGKKSKNAKMAAVGVLYTLRKTEDGLEGPVNKRVYGTFESYRALFEWLLSEAKKRGYGTEKFTKILFIADGAETLWDLQQEFFPNVEVCLDWYHVVEKLWKTGKALHRNSRKKLEAWVAEQKKRLRRGQVQAVIDELRAILDATARTGPGNKYRRTVLDNTVAHFTKNASRMRYHALRRQDLDIGSGIIEGAVRHLVGVRLDGPGMRWSRDRMEAVLLLRCILIDGQWEDFTRFLAAKNGVALRSQPIPTRTHDAKPKLKPRLKKAA